MFLPPELQYMIIEFVPYTEFKLVSKEWKDEINSIQKKAVDIIGNWYPVLSRTIKTHKDIIRSFVIRTSVDLFILHPEITVEFFSLNRDLLSIIPSLNTRKRVDVRDWINNIPIPLEDWLIVYPFYHIP
jgi:hypothetical protein